MDLVATRSVHEDPRRDRGGSTVHRPDSAAHPWPTEVRLRVGRALIGGGCLQQALYNSDSAQQAVIDLEAEAPSDLVVAHLVRTVPWLQALGSSSVPVFVDIQDALSAQYREARGRAKGWRGWAMTLEQRRVAVAEREAVRRADGVTFISARDAAELDCGTTPVAIAGAAFLGASVSDRSLPLSRVGSGSWETSAPRRIATWSSGLPERRSFDSRPAKGCQLPHFWSGGASGSSRSRRSPGGDLRREVEDVGQALSSCWFTVCPQRFGSGVQNKVIESLAYGTPALISPSAAEGLGTDGPFLIAALGPDFLADALRLLDDSDLRLALAVRGPAWVEERHQPTEALAGLLAMARRLRRDSVGSTSRREGSVS